jgi:hypothetical protein
MTRMRSEAEKDLCARIQGSAPASALLPYRKIAVWKAKARLTINLISASLGKVGLVGGPPALLLGGPAWIAGSPIPFPDDQTD